MREEVLTKSLLDILQLSIDLANSVRADIATENSAISNETVLAVSNFRAKHDELETVLDILNGVH